MGSYKNIFCVFFAWILTACAGSSGSFQVESSSSSSGGNYLSIESMEGLYLGAFPRKQGCTLEQDKNYIYVSPQGVVTWYDYQDDDCGTGDTCYRLMDSPPAYAPGELRERAGGLEVRLNPIYPIVTRWGRIKFFEAKVYSGVSFEVDNFVLSKLMKAQGDTELPFGTKVSEPTIADIESHICG